jgi:hypothetical protein
MVSVSEVAWAKLGGSIGVVQSMRTLFTVVMNGAGCVRFGHHHC